MGLSPAAWRSRVFCFASSEHGFPNIGCRSPAKYPFIFFECWIPARSLAIEKCFRNPRLQDLTCVVNNAGYGLLLPFEDTSPKEIEDMFRTNVFGLWYLADQLAVSRQTVNAIETGRYDPSLPLAFAIARLFGATIEEIFTP